MDATLDAFEVRLASQEDEPEIRALVAATAMPGAVAVRFAREPDYFLGTTIMGDPCDVVVVRDRRTGRLAGIGCRAERRAFVNGREERIGYIGQIRAADGYRGRWLVQRAMAWLRDGRHTGLLYCGVVARENPRARELLVGRRAPGAPVRTRLGGLTTCAIMLRPRHLPRIPGVDVEPGSARTIPEIVGFLREEGPRRQLFPAYAVRDFTDGRTLRGLAPEDVAVARRGGRIVGVMAAWDQSAYKQDVVASYGPTLRRLHPAYDALARVLGARPLTPPGAAIPLSFAACTAVAGDDPAVMRSLLAACAERARGLGNAFLMVGLADGDPLLPVVRRWLHVTYRSDLFTLAWNGAKASIPDGRVPFIEIATL
ncbi:MAG: hypothetical protein V2B17_04530 [Chloroflexota bacterium]